MIGVVRVKFGSGKCEASFPEGGGGDKGACRREPLSGLDEDVGSVGGLESEGQAGHGVDLKL